MRMKHDGLAASGPAVPADSSAMDHKKLLNDHSQWPFLFDFLWFMMIFCINAKEMVSFSKVHLKSCQVNQLPGYLLCKFLFLVLPEFNSLGLLWNRAVLHLMFLMKISPKPGCLTSRWIEDKDIPIVILIFLTGYLKISATPHTHTNAMQTLGII